MQLSTHILAATEAASTAVMPSTAQGLIVFPAQGKKPQILFKKKLGDMCLHLHRGQTLEQPEVQI